MNVPRDWDRWGAVLVSAVVTGAFAAVLILLVFKPIEYSPNTLSVLQVMLGALTASFSAVVNYWLGSSSGSRRKDDAMTAIAQATVTTPAAEQ